MLSNAEHHVLSLHNFFFCKFTRDKAGVMSELEKVLFRFTIAVLLQFLMFLMF